MDPLDPWGLEQNNVIGLGREVSDSTAFTKLVRPHCDAMAASVILDDSNLFVEVP